MWALSERRLRTTLLVGFLALSWITLWAWSRTPYGQHFHHAAIGSASFQPDLRSLLSFALGWALMTVAMMLPTSFPLLGLFRSLVSERKHRAWLVALCIAGYIATWVLFGMLAHFGVSQLYAFVTDVNFQTALLLVAGIYQFTPLKHYCLQKCRSPLSFISEHWHGKNEAAESFWLGAHHGLFCIGCCWSLMLLMFLAVTVHMLWMLLLGTMMAIEKNMTWGRRISVPLGAVLILAAVVVKIVG
jgi:predicted metal-binding membrane protein